MVKSPRLRSYFQFLILFILCALFFLPFFITPNLLIHKDNDLGRTYIPIFNFIHKSFYENKTFPLWRPDQLMGETFIGNPLFSEMYPLNILFLILPVGIATIFYYFVHVFIAGIFTYLLSRSYGFSKSPSFLAAILYAFSTNMLLHISAGHITMVAAFSYFPLLFLGARKLLKSFSLIWVLSVVVALVFMLFLYPTILYYSLIFSFAYIFYYLLTNYKHLSLMFLGKRLGRFLAVFALFLGLSAIQLFPEIEFGPLSTRLSLRLEDVALPLWNAKKFFISALFPYLKFNELDHESFLYLGLVPMTLSILGFIFLPKFKKIILAIFALFTILFVAGLSTPVFPLAYKTLPYLEYSRITTRLWFIVSLISALLAAQFVERLKKDKIIYILILIFLVEMFYIGYRKILSVADLSFGNNDIYEYIKDDPDIFRVYCTTYCFNPQQTSTNRFQVLHGENPLQDKSIVNLLQVAGGYSYSNFAVIFPPYQVWQVKTPPKPDAQLLGFANVKYVASTYEIENNSLKLINKFNNLFLYKNELFKPRAYFKNSTDPAIIEKYSPNRISVSFNQSNLQRDLIFSEKYYPGWFAYINNKKYKVDLENPIFRKVSIPPGVDGIEMVYEPKSLGVGETITLTTILFLIIYMCYNLAKSKKRWLKL